MYANSQENISEWNADEKGYFLDGLVLSSEWWRYVGHFYSNDHMLSFLNAIVSSILSVMITFGVYFAIWHVAPSKKDEKNFLFSHTFIWCGVALLTQINLVFFFKEILVLISWRYYHESCDENACESKSYWIIWMVIYMFIAFIILLIRRIRGKTVDQDLLVPEWRAFILASPYISNPVLLTVVIYQFSIGQLLKVKSFYNAGIHFKETLAYFVKCPKLLSVFKKMIKFLSVYILYMTVFMSVSIFSYNIVPVLLQAFLYPFRIFAAYSYAFAAFALFAFSSFIATFLWKEEKPTTGKLILYLSSTSIGLLFISMISTPFVTLYQLLVSGNFTDSPLVLAGASILPSVILSSPLIWIFKQKLLPRFLEIDEDDESEENEKEEKRPKKKYKLQEASGTNKDIDVEIQNLGSDYHNYYMTL